MPRQRCGSPKGALPLARFFIAASNIFGGIATLSASDRDHLRVLRIRRGETFTVCDGAGTDYICRLGDGDSAEIIEAVPSVGEPTVKCSVYAAYSKGERMDLTVQKCVELGAHEIILFPSERCVSRPDGTSALKKIARWQKIAEEAAKQSGRGVIPLVTGAASYKDAVISASAADLPLFFYEEEKELSLKAALESKPDACTVSIMTGPEGGFEPKEAALAVQHGMQSVTLGPRILRCETAPMCGVAAVMLFTGNM